MNKTAQEMFEEAGYGYALEYVNKYLLKKIYYIEDNMYHTQVTFYIELYGEIPNCVGYNVISDLIVDKELHKLINCQLQELGWLDEE